MMKVNEFSIDTFKLMETMSDNIFIADKNMKLIWINEEARNLVTELLPYLPAIAHPDDLIGMYLQEIHGQKSNFFKVMKKKNFPHKSKVPIFGYTADLFVNELFDQNGDMNGYILIWRDVTKEEQQRMKSEKMIEEMSTPILPVVLNNALFAPLIGTFDKRRFDHLRERVLTECVKSGADYLIFDFSGVTVVENELLVDEFERLRATVQLLGAHTFFCGFSSELVKLFTKNKVKVEERTFSQYQQAIHHVLYLEGLEITPRKKT
ncbi:STAS domain-containing protein [Alteribacter keqinensis]|uniref:STAS domain-containing protein n=1 Tax=Alteribacter keqinensis TaxID=2483800 RepID=A0A3M7TXT6_9BACI|nr:STAS domain-containing protein [Alteribacter keqinensis]RNA70101.1 STAS domain-containing protein [Alteribacter keqinensis]